MHLIIRALRIGIRVSFGLCLLLVCGAAEEEQQVLDLTRQIVPKDHSLGLPGQSIGGTTAKAKVKESYELPVRLEVKRLRMGEESVELELRITNLGESVFDVPSCLDGQKAFQSGATNHRTMEYGLAVESPSPVIPESIEVTFGSSHPECSTYIKPGQSLLVIFSAVCPEGILEIRKQSAHLVVRAFVAETRFDDHRFYVRDRSKKVESQPLEVTF
jgi:hypothetical protein